MSRRSAFTLTEMLVAISAGSTLMLLAIGTVHQALQFSSTCRDRAENGRSATRLAEQFRHDIHRAEEVTVSSNVTVKIKLLDASELNYTADGNRITREQPLASGEIRRELFTFSEKSSVKFAELNDPQRAAVILQRETGLSGMEPRIDRQIAAVVGRLRTYELAGEPLP